MADIYKNAGNAWMLKIRPEQQMHNDGEEYFSPKKEREPFRRKENW